MMVCPEGSIKVNGRGLSPWDLIPLPPRDERASADQLQNLLKARRSVRRFSKRSVEPAAISRIVEMASSAPMGVPPWDIGCVVINDRNKVRELAGELVRGYEQFLKTFRPWMLRAMRPFVKKATYEQFSLFIRPLAQKYVTAWHEGRDKLFYDAPAVIIFHHSPYCEAAEAMIPCTYAMLAAESLHLGATIIGAAAPVLRRNPRLCDRLGIPRSNKPAVALIVGHPAVRFRKSVRRHFSSLSTNGFAGAYASFPAPRNRAKSERLPM
jgi:nitroreductase